MAVKLNQSLKQTQGLVFTPQLQQAIKLLTLNHLEMTNIIAEEMVENPLLEELGAEGTEKNETDYRLEQMEGENTEATSEDFSQTDHLSANDNFDFEQYIESYNSHSSAMPPSMTGPMAAEDMPNYENITAPSATLSEHLAWQLRMGDLSKKEQQMAQILIHNINDDGYLDISLAEVAQQTDHSREEVQAILGIIQGLDPVGCGARDLKECLMIQARMLVPRIPLVEQVIAQCLELLQQKNPQAIAKQLQAKEEQVAEVKFIISEFNPRPGRLISNESTHYIAPDVVVRNIGGELKVEVNDEGVPRLRISRLYRQMLQQGGDRTTKDYVQGKLRNALWLIKSIQNRQSTIYRVAEAIVRYQPNFFRKGAAFLRPLFLKDIAGELGVHESTVSRATTNKYMYTPLGTFELKYFFGAGIGGKNGGIDVAGEALKSKIKELVDSESPKAPLSDQKMVNILKTQDIAVARRTVAKYRDLLGIADSRTRKQNA